MALVKTARTRSRASAGTKRSNQLDPSASSRAHPVNSRRKALQNATRPSRSNSTAMRRTSSSTSRNCMSDTEGATVGSGRDASGRPVVDRVMKVRWSLATLEPDATVVRTSAGVNDARGTTPAARRPGRGVNAARAEHPRRVETPVGPVRPRGRRPGIELAAPAWTRTPWPTFRNATPISTACGTCCCSTATRSARGRRTSCCTASRTSTRAARPTTGCSTRSSSSTQGAGLAATTAPTSISARR